jgi:hypothetical protein
MGVRRLQTYLTRVFKPDKLQLAVVRTSHILANCNLPLKTALGGTTFRFLLLTNSRILNISLVVILFRGFSPKRFVNVESPAITFVLCAKNNGLAFFRGAVILTFEVCFNYLVSN